MLIAGSLPAPCGVPARLRGPGRGGAGSEAVCSSRRLPACSAAQRGSAGRRRREGLGTPRARPCPRPGSPLPLPSGERRLPGQLRRCPPPPRAELTGGGEPPSPAAVGAGTPGTVGLGRPRTARPGESRGGPGLCRALPRTPRAGGRIRAGSFCLAGREGAGEGWGLRAESPKSLVCALIIFFFLSFSFFRPFFSSFAPLAPSLPSLVLSVPAHPTLPSDPAIPALASPCH